MYSVAEGFVLQARADYGDVKKSKKSGEICFSRQPDESPFEIDKHCCAVELDFGQGPEYSHNPSL